MKTGRIIADFRVDCVADIHNRLNAAVAEAHAEASTGGILGVLVTRHDFNRFSVALSPEVPYRLTRERDHLHRNSHAQHTPIP
jgi:hypothetical protein